MRFAYRYLSAEGGLANDAFIEIFCIGIQKLESTILRLSFEKRPFKKVVAAAEHSVTSS